MEKQLKPFDRVIFRDPDFGVYRGSFVSCYKNDSEVILVDGTCVKECDVYKYEHDGNMCGTHVGIDRKEGQTYYSITMFGTIEELSDDLDSSDDELYDFGNYFLNVKDAKKMRDKIKEVLTENKN